MKKELLKLYKLRKKEIKSRLKNFKAVRDNEIFKELCFCLLTPQSNAFVCDNAIKKFNNELFYGSYSEIKKGVYPIRFYKNKSRYIVEARKTFSQEKLNGNEFNNREWLVKNVKGLGYKEASHFLRNIGKSEKLAILDRHILKNLVKLKVIHKLPKTLTKKHYLAIEEKMQNYADKLNMSLNELDLLLWAKETNVVFK